ncbi:MAG: pantetheine-phosphate adenylyltransferase, partial [Bacteroidetes bacterium]|nr:pantetheine-phosphate adenylyltransferase [Bacteroidota bacterium]
IIKRAMPLFDEIIIAVGENSEKESFFPIEKRIGWIKKVFADYPSIRVTRYKGLTVDFCKKNNAKYLLRGLRTSADFEFERSIGQVNKKLFPEIETIFLLTTPELTAINSSIVRDIIRHGGDPSQFVPDEINLS